MRIRPGEKHSTSDEVLPKKGLSNCSFSKVCQSGDRGRFSTLPWGKKEKEEKKIKNDWIRTAKQRMRKNCKNWANLNHESPCMHKSHEREGFDWFDEKWNDCEFVRYGKICYEILKSVFGSSDFSSSDSAPLILQVVDFLLSLSLGLSTDLSLCFIDSPSKLLFLLCSFASCFLFAFFCQQLENTNWLDSSASTTKEKGYVESADECFCFWDLDLCQWMSECQRLIQLPAACEKESFAYLLHSSHIVLYWCMSTDDVESMNDTRNPYTNSKKKSISIFFWSKIIIYSTHIRGLSR